MPSSAPQYPEFPGKVAVVTGAARGMGACFAEGLAKQGVHVLAGDVDAEQVEATATSIAAARGGSITGISMDVRLPEEHAKVAAMARERFGRLDYWINNAGVLSGAAALEISPEELRDTFAVNVNGTTYGSQTAAKSIGPDSGAIVNMASVTALRVRPNRGAYSMTKAGVDHFTRILAVELAASGIRVNAIAPGLIETDMTRWVHDDPAVFERVVKRVPLGRMGAPDDILDVALFLLSDSARYITGATIVVDGGESQLS